jgi:MFS family permease
MCMSFSTTSDAYANTPRGAAGIVAGTILQAASINYGMMIFARIFNGIFNGMLTSTVPTYQSECAKPHQRGQLLLFSGSLITFVSLLVSTLARWPCEAKADTQGVMTSYWIGLAFYYTTGQIAWRFPVTFQCVFTFAMYVRTQSI